MTEATASSVKAGKAESKDGKKKEVKHLSYGALIARRFFRQPSAVVGVVILAVLIFFALFGSYVGQWGYDEPDFMALAAPPSSSHWLGTDPGGSDLYALVVHGLGKSLLIGVITSVATMAIASIYGTAIAFFGGWVERVGMWILDCLLVIPSFLLIAMLVRAANAKAGWIWLVVGLTAFGWVGYARIIRTMTLSLRERDYIKAARFMGVGSFKIILRHLVPNLASMIIINTVLGVVGAVNSETALSFLSVGIKPPDTSLGAILQTGQSTIQTAPWILLVPSVALILLTFSMQLIGDGLRDALDPNSAAGGKVGA
ncbi:ABC transporter permease [Bifidobacterium avesanii]|uniref:Oligopeptide transport system permease protein OppC n=1 Tax=Bifidobacterium avesanii TaxID=1798157 RepID=A0A7K3TJN9_9BIFI|nr:ABC transporter permease [Bifidobacterium avesanii]KAB8289895.1 peptide ABC transporter permease [Bifidobacterium avesanii]NEG78864.1 ABC transporter permease subunit [Bifidobacterium avesanii]